MRRASLFSLLVLSTVAAKAHAGTASSKLAKAKEAADSVQFERARKLLVEAMESGDATVDETWQLYALEGELSAATGDAARADHAFRAAISLMPSYAPREGASPRILDPFAQARRRVTRPLSASASLTAVAPNLVSVTASVEGDELGLVQAARVQLSNGPMASLRRSGTTHYEAKLACSAVPCEARILLVDEWGNELSALSARTALTPTPREETPPPAVSLPAPSPKPPLFQRPALYLGVASVALLAAGTYFGVRAQSEQQQLLDMDAHRSEHTLAEAKSLDVSRRTHHTYMWIGLGAAAVAGAGAVWLW